MSSTPESQPRSATAAPSRAEYHGYTEVVDYILGITFEIWEQRQVETILDYYGEDIDVFSLEGLTHGSAIMVEQTHATLESFPDRLLLADDVIWSGDLSRGFSSHRIISPMTNLGDTSFGAATGRPVVTMNIADCEITEGRISREWLLRDNLALVQQLGIGAEDAARTVALKFNAPQRNWLNAEIRRVGGNDRATTIGSATTDAHEAFARQVLQACWQGANPDFLESAYAPYCVLHRAPVRTVSGRQDLLQHYADWRGILPEAKLSLDHICSQPFGKDGHNVAVRWSVAGRHEGELNGLQASGKPLYIVGVTHWRILNGRIVMEWTVFDEIGIMAQVLDEKN